MDICTGVRLHSFAIRTGVLLNSDIFDHANHVPYFVPLLLFVREFFDGALDDSRTGLPLTWKTWKSQGICDRIPKVREFCCLKFIFSQIEDPNFENFLGEHSPRSP